MRSKISGFSRFEVHSNLRERRLIECRQVPRDRRGIRRQDRPSQMRDRLPWKSKGDGRVRKKAAEVRNLRIQPRCKVPLPERQTREAWCDESEPPWLRALEGESECVGSGQSGRRRGAGCLSRPQRQVHGGEIARSFLLNTGSCLGRTTMRTAPCSSTGGFVVDNSLALKRTLPACRERSSRDQRQEKSRRLENRCRRTHCRQ